jgi:hypothetical protein
MDDGERRTGVKAKARYDGHVPSEARRRDDEQWCCSACGQGFLMSGGAPMRCCVDSPVTNFTTTNGEGERTERRKRAWGREKEEGLAGFIECRRFETGGSLGRRVNVAACPSPDGSSARASAKGGERGGRRPA